MVNERFALMVPKNLDPAAAAPLLCAGITTYSPLRHWKVGPGQKVGIVGLGGLGHMAVKLAKAMGAEVVLFTTSAGKVEDGKRLGASSVVVSKNADEMAPHANTFDFILDTVSAKHDINAYLQLLKRDGTMVLVGAPPTPIALVGVQPVVRPQAPRRLGDRRPRRDPGDARLLRQAQHHRRHRDDPDAEDQRRLRAAAEAAT